MPRRGDVTARCDSLQAAASILLVLPVRCQRWDVVGFCGGLLLLSVLFCCASAVHPFVYVFIFVLARLLYISWVNFVIITHKHNVDSKKIADIKL
jgi:hypothetical protein